MFAVFNRAISRRSSCTLWRNSSIVVATVRFYTRGVRAVHKTEHLSTVFGSITPVTPCTGEAEQIVLLQLKAKTGRDFAGNVWKFVEQADALGIKDIGSPVQRPSAQDALNELAKL